MIDSFIHLMILHAYQAHSFTMTTCDVLFEELPPTAAVVHTTASLQVLAVTRAVELLSHSQRLRSLVLSQ